MATPLDEDVDEYFKLATKITQAVMKYNGTGKPNEEMEGKIRELRTAHQSLSAALMGGIAQYVNAPPQPISTSAPEKK